MKRLAFSIFIIMFFISPVFSLDRNFILFLGTVPKSGGSLEATELPSRKAIEDMYFSEGIVPAEYGGSWHEWAVENSYGVERYIGEVPAWVALPWPMVRGTSFVDLNSNGIFEYGAYDIFFSDTEVADNWFTPGERYKDINGNGRWNDHEPWFDCYAFVDNQGRHYDRGDGGRINFLLNSKTLYPAREDVWDRHGEAFVDYNEDGQYSGIVPITVADKNLGINRVLLINELYIPRSQDYTVKASDFPLDWTTAPGTTGSNNRLYYYDEDGNGIYTLGEDIWKDWYETDENNPLVDPDDNPGVYDANDILIFDGGDGWRIKNFPGLFSGIQNGMYFPVGDLNTRDGGDGDNNYEGGGEIGRNNDNESLQDTQVYDGGNNVFDTANGTSGKTDTHIKYVDSNSNSAYDDDVDPVFWDVNNNGTFDVGVDYTLVGPEPDDGTSGFDPTFYYHDYNDNDVFDYNPAEETGEEVWLDDEVVDGNYTSVIAKAYYEDIWLDVDGEYRTGETILSNRGSLRTGDLGLNSGFRFLDSDGNGQYSDGETLWYETTDDTTFDYAEDSFVGGGFAGDGTYHILTDHVIVDNGDLADADTGSQVKLYFKDIGEDGQPGNGFWDEGEPIYYEALAPVGEYNVTEEDTRLYSGDDGWTTKQGMAGSNTGLYYLDSNGNNEWDSGEPVWYEDLDPAGTYNSSDNLDTQLSDKTAWETAEGTQGNKDVLMLYDDTSADDQWDAGEGIWYDVNADGAYRSKDVKVYSGDGDWLNTPVGSAGIKGNLVYNDLNGNTEWESGEAVWADSANTTYNAADDTLIYGLVAEGTAGRASDNLYFKDAQDTHVVTAGAWNPADGAQGIQGDLCFWDINNNSKWNAGEPIWKDNGDNSYTAADDTLISGNAPSDGTAGTAGNLFFEDTTVNNVYDSGSEDIWADDGIANTEYDAVDGVWSNVEDIWADDGVDDGTYNIDSQDTKVSSGDGLWVDTPVNSQGSQNDIRFYDENGNSQWNNGEAVWKDDGTNLEVYDADDTLLSGSAPALGTAGVAGNIYYYDNPTQDTNVYTGAGDWDNTPAGSVGIHGDLLFFDDNNNKKYDYNNDEPIWKDVDGNGRYNAAVDTYIAVVGDGGEPNESKPGIQGDLYFYDIDGDTLFTDGTEVIWVDDGLEDGIYNADDDEYTASYEDIWADSGEADTLYNAQDVKIYGTIVAGTTGGKSITADTEQQVWFNDVNGNEKWEQNEDVWADVGGVDGKYNDDLGPGDKLLHGDIDEGTGGGETIGSSTGLKVWFFDSSATGTTGVWDVGDDVWADVEGGDTGKYDEGGDFLILGGDIQAGDVGKSAVNKNIYYENDNGDDYYNNGIDSVWAYTATGGQHAWNVFFDDTDLDGRLNGTYDPYEDDVWFETDNGVFDLITDKRLYDGEGYAYEGDRFQVNFQDMRLTPHTAWETVNGTAGVQTGLYIYDSNQDGDFSIGDGVFYDADGDGVYIGPDFQVYLGTEEIEGNDVDWDTPHGTAGIQSGVYFVDYNQNNEYDEAFDSGVWADINRNGRYEPDIDEMRVGAEPASGSLGIHGDLWYYDAGGLAYVPDADEEIWKDSGPTSGVYDHTGPDTRVHGAPITGRDVSYYIAANTAPGSDGVYYHDENANSAYDANPDEGEWEDAWWDIDLADDEGVYNEQSNDLNKTFDPALDNAGLPIIYPLTIAQIGGGTSQAEVSWEYISEFDDNGDPVSFSRRTALAYESYEPWTDLDGDLEYDFEEPWEDYMARWDPFSYLFLTSTPVDFSIPTVPLVTPGYTPVSKDYIDDNYPGNIDALWSRTGNAEYNPGEKPYVDGTAAKVYISGWSSSPGVLPPGESWNKSEDPTWDLTKFDDSTWRDWWTRQFSANGYTSTAPHWNSPYHPITGLKDYDLSGHVYNETPIISELDEELDEEELRTFKPNQGFRPGSDEEIYSIYSEAEVNSPGRWGGPPEYFDLASALHHTTWPWYPPPPASTIDPHFNGHGDGRVGEETDPLSTSITGADRSTMNDPNVRGTDNVVISGGPLAHNLYGDNGRDSANLANLEILTWRTDGVDENWILPYDDPLTGRKTTQYRDLNLDGFIDQGECPVAGTMNYTADLDPGTADTGEGTHYPYCRRRLLEDCFEANDDALDYDKFAKMGDGSHINTAALTDAAEGYPLGRSPLTYSVYTADSDNTFTYSDWRQPHNASSLEGGAYEAGVPEDDEWFQDYGRGLLAHEFGHYWYSWPDLYDYDVGSGLIINWPIGRYDLMSAGGLVHSIPSLKRWGDAKWVLGSAGDPTLEATTGSYWTEFRDLKRIVIPGVPYDVKMEPVEFIKNQYYVFQNENYGEEQYIFWYRSGLGFQVLDPTNGTPDDPKQGIMILHTDYMSNADGIPLQNRKGNHYTWNIVQCDAKEQLEEGKNLGDDGDIWPGGSDYIEAGGEAKYQFGPNTDPMNRWWDQTPCGIEIIDIDLPADPLAPAVVRFFMDPKTIPTLSFIHPPGGNTVDGVYKVKFNAYDVFGAARLYLFLDTDTEGYDGVCLNSTAIPVSGNLTTQFGFNQDSVNATWNTTEQRWENDSGHTIMFNDTKRDRVWTQDEDVWADIDDNGKYDTGETQYHLGVDNNGTVDWDTVNGTTGEYNSYCFDLSYISKIPKDVEMDYYVNENSLNEGNNYFYSRLIPQKNPDQPVASLYFSDEDFDGVWDYGEMLWEELNNKEYYHEHDLVLINGGYGDTPKMQLVNYFFNDVNDNGYWDVGGTEDIWKDIDPFGVYDGSETQIYAGGDGWTTASGIQGRPFPVLDTFYLHDLRSHTRPRLLEGAAGEGELNVTYVDYVGKYGIGSKLETWTVEMVDETSQEWEVRGTLSGLQTNRAVTGQLYTSDDNEIVLMITNRDVNLNGTAPAFEKGDMFAFMTTGLTAYSGGVKVEDGDLIGVEVLLEIADMIPAGDRVDVNSERYDVIAFNMKHANVTSQELQLEKIRMMISGSKTEPDADNDGELDDLDANNQALNLTSFLRELTSGSSNSGLLFYYDNGNEDGRWDTADSRLDYIYTSWDLVENTADDIQKYGQGFVRKYGKNYYNDANANGRWDTDEDVWLDSYLSGSPGVYDDGADIQIVTGSAWTTSSGTNGKVYQQYYLTDIFFSDGVQVPVDDKHDNEGFDFFISLRTGSNLRFTDKVYFTIPEEGVHMSSGITGLSEFVTRELDGNVPVFFTDYLGGNTLSKNTTFPAFGMNVGAREDDGSPIFLNSISVRIMDAGSGNVTSADFQELKADGMISGVSLWKDAESGQYSNGRFDWNDLDGDGEFDLGEPTWDDANGNGIYDEDETMYDTPVMFTQTPIWSFGKVTMNLPNPTTTFYNDKNSNGRWEINEEIWTDGLGGSDGFYEAGIDRQVYAGSDSNSDGDFWETSNGQAGVSYSIPYVPLSVDDSISNFDPDRGDDFFVTLTTSNYTENSDVFTVGVKEGDIVFKHGNTTYKYGQIYNTTFINSLFTVTIDGSALSLEETATNQYVLSDPVAPGTALTFNASGGISPYTWVIGDEDETEETGDSFIYTTPDSESVGDDGTKILLTATDGIGVEIIIEIPVQADGTEDPGGAGDDEGDDDGDGDGGTDSSMTLVVVQIDQQGQPTETFTSTPATTSVNPGESLLIGVTNATGTINVDVTTNASGATIVNQGTQLTYTAGSTEGADVITFTDEAGNTFSLSIIVQVGAGGITGGFRVYPEEVTVGLSASILLYAMGGSGSYSWTIVTNSSGCTIDPSTGSSVTYTSGSEDRQVDVVEVMDNVTLETKQITIRVLSGASGTSTKSGSGSGGGGCFIGVLRK